MSESSLVKKSIASYLADDQNTKTSADEMENASLEEVQKNKAFLSNLFDKGSSVIGQKISMGSITPIKTSRHDQSSYFEILSKPLDLSKLKIFKKLQVQFVVSEKGNIRMGARYDMLDGGSNGAELAILTFDLKTASTVKIVKSY